MRSNLLRIGAAVLAAAAGTSPVAFAQAPAPMQDHHGMTMPGGAARPGARAVSDRSTEANHQEMMTAMERMSREMMAPQAMTGDPDRDLVAMMIPHHQGAIDMARIYLRDGKDPAIRRMAETIIRDQEREIRDMRAWQARQPGAAR